jgi:hypothetical protein
MTEEETEKEAKEESEVREAQEELALVLRDYLSI